MISNVYVCFACFNSQIQKCLSQFVVFSFKFSILLIIDFTPLYCCCCCSHFFLLLLLSVSSHIDKTITHLFHFHNRSVSSFVRFILNPFVNYFSPIFLNTNKHFMVIIKYFLFSICINHISHNLVTLVRLVKMTKGIL